MPSKTVGSRGIHGNGSRGLDRWMYPYRGTPQGRPWVAVAPQIALLAAGLMAYFAVRGLTRGAEATAVANARDLLDLQAMLGLDLEYGIQQWALDRPAAVRAANTAYVWGYWPPLLGALVYFWVCDRRQYTIVRDALILSGAAGLVVFAGYPVAPPRFLDGFVDTIAESRRGMFIAQPPGFVNKFAALPSFHTGWLALVGAATAPHVPERWRPFAWAPFTVMCAAVVITGNHYLVDIAAGVSLSLLGLRVATQIHDSAPAYDRLAIIDHGTMRVAHRPLHPALGISDEARSSDRRA